MFNLESKKINCKFVNNEPRCIIQNEECSFFKSIYEKDKCDYCVAGLCHHSLAITLSRQTTDRGIRQPELRYWINLW